MGKLNLLRLSVALLSINYCSFSEKKETSTQLLKAKYVSVLKASDLKLENKNIRKKTGLFHEGVEFTFQCENLHLLSINKESKTQNDWALEASRYKGNTIFRVSKPNLKEEIERLKIKYEAKMKIAHGLLGKNIPLDEGKIKS